MNRFLLTVLGVVVFQLFAGAASGWGQSTAFTYQGRLIDVTVPANGTYDFKFALFATNSGGTMAAGPVTNSTTGVSNGLFLTAIDFGRVFTGTNYWLDISVRTNGADGFIALWPRQALTPAPFALYAATAGNLPGSLPASQITGLAPAVAAIVSTSAIPLENIAVTVTNITVPALGGTNDDTAVFAAAFNSGMPVSCPIGDFNVTNIVIHTDNEVIYGYGCRLHMRTNCTGYCVSTRGMTNVSIAGLSVYGGIQQNPGWMMGSAPIVAGGITWSDYNCVTLPLGLNTPNNARSGFFCSMQGRGRYADLTANGFNVAGFYLANPLGIGAAGAPVGIFQNNFADWCYVGFEVLQGLHSCDFTTNNVYLPYDEYGVIPGFGGADYTILEAPVAHNCTFGINDSAWNVPINNPQISGCSVGINICANDHNTVTGGSINHCSGGASLAYLITGCAQGPVITGQEILDNPWNVYVSQAASVTFANCQFNYGQFLGTNLLGAVVIVNCFTNGGTITTDNTGLNFVNCFGPGSTNAASVAGSPTIYANNVVPVPQAVAGTFWNSNNALYWVTTTHTNYVTGP